MPRIMFRSFIDAFMRLLYLCEHELSGSVGLTSRGLDRHAKHRHAEIGLDSSTS